MKPLSIIIPTRNREKFCMNVIDSILELYKDYDFELVICDNSDGFDLENKVKNMNNDKLVYKHYLETLSFVENFNRALLLSSGEYVIFIGDDDSVCENIFSLTAWASKNNVSCVKFNTNLSYFWPGVKTGKASTGELTLRNYIYRIKHVDTKKGLCKMLHEGYFDYQEYDLPRLYHGLVSRKLLNEVYDRINKYFDGLSPDIYISVVLSLLCEDMVIVNEPFTLSGVCKSSGSAASISGKHTGELKDAPHFVGHDDYQWNKDVPYIYTVQTIWADTAMHAIKDLNEDKIIECNFNKKRFLKNLIHYYPMFENRIFDEYKKEYGKDINKLGLKILFKFKEIKSFIRRGSLYAFRKLTGRYVYYNLDDIYSALPLANKFIDSKKGIKDEK